MSEVELLARLQEAQRAAAEREEEMREYAEALNSRDELLRKSTRLLAQERRKAADLQAAFTEQARQLQEAEALVSTMVAGGARLPPDPDESSFIRVEDASFTDVLMLRCAHCSLLIAADKLESHGAECGETQRRQRESRQTLQVKVVDPRVEANTGQLTVKIITHTDMPAFGVSLVELRRALPDFLWLQRALSAHHPACIVPPLAVSVEPGSDAAMALCVTALQRFLSRLAAHPILRRSTLLCLFLSASKELLLDAMAEPLPEYLPAVELEEEDHVENDHFIDRTRRYLGRLQDAAEEAVRRLQLRRAVAEDHVLALGGQAGAVSALAASESQSAIPHHVCKLLAATLEALGAAEAEDTEALLALQEGLQSVGDFAAAADALAARLEAAVTATRACRRWLAVAEGTEAKEELAQGAREAARLADDITDRIWDELQLFEQRQSLEVRELVLEHAVAAVQAHQRRMCKWAGLTQAVAALALPAAGAAAGRARLASVTQHPGLN